MDYVAGNTADAAELSDCKIIASRSFNMFRKQSEARGVQTALAEEMISGQKTVRAFGYEKRASGQFRQINEELKEYSQKAVFYSSLTNPCTRFVNNIIYAGVALVGSADYSGRGAYRRRTYDYAVLCKSVYEAL